MTGGEAAAFSVDVDVHRGPTAASSSARPVARPIARHCRFEMAASTAPPVRAGEVAPEGAVKGVAEIQAQVIVRRLLEVQ